MVLNKAVSLDVTQRHVTHTAAVVALDMPATRSLISHRFTVRTGQSFVPWVADKSM
jgi:hypothetical protein